MSHNTNKRIAQNTLFLYFRTLVILLVSLYTSRVVLNVLGIDDYGIYNVVGGIVLMFQFLNVGMIDVSQRFLTYELGKNDGQQLQKVFSTSLIIHLIIIFFLLILAETVGLWFLNHKMNIPTSRIIAANWVFQFSILTFIIKIFSVPYNASIVAHEHMKVYAYVSILEVILQLAIVFLLKGSASDKLILYAILMSFVTLLISIMYTLYCKKYFKECKFRNDIDKQLLHKMLSFAGWSFGNSATSMIGNYGLGIVLNMFFGTVLNAAQGIAGQISGQLSVFASNMLKALNPVIGKSAGASNHDLSTKIALSGCKFTFLITAIFTLPVIIEAPYILSLWLKQVPEYTVIFTQLQLIRTLIEQLTLVLNTSISAQGNIKRISIIITLLNILPLPLIYTAFHFGAPPYAMYLISIAIWSIFEGGIRIYFAWKNCQIPPRSYFITTLIPCLSIAGISLLTGGIIINIMPSGILRLIITVSCCTGVFILSFLYKGVNAEERERLTLLVKSLKNKIK